MHFATPMEGAKAKTTNKRIEMKTTDNNGLSELWTAEMANEHALKEILDMRDQIIVDGNGKKGLCDVGGTVLIEPQFDDIPELYTCLERTSLIPVVLDNHYFLYDIREHKLLTKGYRAASSVISGLIWSILWLWRTARRASSTAMTARNSPLSTWTRFMRCRILTEPCHT